MFKSHLQEFITCKWLFHSCNCTTKKAGNRKKKVEDGVETEYTYNELNQLQSETTEGQETISYAYDTNGNLLCRETTTEYETYTYTGANQLESVTSTTKAGETKEVYEYDAEGNRLSKTESKAVKSVDKTIGEVTTYKPGKMQVVTNIHIYLRSTDLFLDDFLP